jgi:hypothetical protein
MGLLDERSAEQQEIERLENAIRQMKMGAERTGQRIAQGDVGSPGELTYLQQLQQRMQQGAEKNQGLLSELTQPQQQQSPEQQQIAQLENQIQMLQGMDPSGAGGVYGMLGYQERGAQSGFEPTIAPDRMNEVFGLLAEYSDDPTAVGMQYVKSMQANDALRAANKDAKFRITDAMRPKPVGSGYEDADGYQVQPIYDPNLNNGRGGMRSEKIGKRKTHTITIAGVQYQRNPFQTNPNAPDYWMPSVDPRTAGVAAGEMEEQIDLGKSRALDQKEQASLANDMALQNGRILDILQAPNFSESVGPFDTLIKTMGGAAMGGADSLLNRQVQILHNQLTTTQVADWKGAISERELDFFHASVPDTTDHHEVWNTWYNTVYVPTMEFAMMRARGEIDATNSSLKSWVESGGGRQPQAGDAALDPLVQKYLQND